ncbi:MAG TPA: M20/M25/M40 family metallo-hydrolase [Candidatus Korarchaeota archaeon]|nr:M20/M25/M40 family metallo-hydrolase [Candidatus Korarchaeota archaeon]
MEWEVKVLEELVRLDTDATLRKNYDKAAEMIARYAEELGMDVSIVGDEVPNVVAKLDVGAEKDLALVSHYDVVPAKGPWKLVDREIDPFEPIVIDGKLYGRGAADDKSAIAASLGAIRELKGEKLRYNPLLIVVGDEEVGGTGIKEVVEKRCITGDAAVILDASIEYLSVGASGVVDGWIKVKGKGGHAGYPHVARNPIYGLVRLIGELEKFASFRSTKLSDLPSPPSSPIQRVWGRFTVTMLRAGQKHNAIPGEASAGFDMRLFPGEDLNQALEELKSFLTDAASRLGLEVELEIVGSVNDGWRTPPDHPFVAEVLSAMERAMGKRAIAAELGGNDGFLFAKRGVPTVAIGAIRVPENNIHAPLEFVYLEDVAALKRLIVELLKPGAS